MKLAVAVTCPGGRSDNGFNQTIGGGNIQVHQGYRCKEPLFRGTSDRRPDARLYSEASLRFDVPEPDIE